MRNLYLLILSTILVFSGCTKDKEAKLPDSTSDTAFKISVFRGSEGTLSTDSKLQSLTDVESLRARGEKPLVKVSSLNVKGVPQAMIEDLNIPGEAKDEIPVRFEIDQYNVHLYKLVDGVDGLTELEKQSLTDEALKEEPIKVRVASYGVRSFGKLENNTDSYGEKTTSLRLKPTSWEQASHVQISFQISSRTVLGASNIEEGEQIFLKDRVDGTVMTAEEMNDGLQIPIKLADDTKVFLKLGGNDTFNVYEVSNISQLTDIQKKWVLEGSNPGILEACPDSVLQQLPASEHGGCVIINRYSGSAEFKVARLNKTHLEGAPTSDLVFDKAKSGDKTNLVKITKNQVLKTVVISNDFDARDILKVADLDGEFLFRRTMNDIANGFRYSFPGSQGRMEIVKFVTEEDSLLVMKADPVVKPNGQTEVDTEAVMSIPATYFKLETVDSQGNPLNVPNEVEARHDDPEAFIRIDWTGNKIPNVLSPLSYHGVGQCFSPASNNLVTDLKQDLKNGVLNFSIEGTYTVGLSLCASRFLTSDYYYSINEQRTFDIKERISFRKYDGSNDNNPVSEIPFYAQRQMNYGVFTMSKIVPNENGNTGREGQEVHLPVLFDFSRGKSVTYTLAGIPKSGKLRSQIIAATEEVVNNWNKALQEAFAGSELGGRSDYLKLEVEGRDVHDVHLGDLDKNFIYWVGKNLESGPLGIGGPSPNPRSGVIEASDVIIYGGNLQSNLEFVQKIAAAKDFYKQIMQFIPAPTEEVEGETGDVVVDTEDGEQSVPESDGHSHSLSADTKDLFGAEGAAFDKFDFKSLISERQGHLAAGKLKQIKEAQLNQDSIMPDFTDLVSARSGALASALFATMNDMANSHAHKHYGRTQTIAQKNFLKAIKSKVTAEDFAFLTGKSLETEFVHSIADQINGGHQVVEMMEGVPSVAGGDILSKTIEELLVEKYAAVLVHELGHALGQTHNFWGSFDKANFFHANQSEENGDSSNSSSVMDYLPFDVWESTEPGPFDVHTIRAAYTGRLEVHDQVKQMAQPLENGDSVLDLGQAQMVLSQGKFMYIEDYKNVLGLRSWLDFDANVARAIPLKDYKYCPDTEVGRHPTCNRFDVGGTALEIAENMIENHRSLYLITNFPDQRIRFDWWNAGGYIGRLFNTFTGLRHFMDESIFRVYTGQIDDTMWDHAQAAYRGMLYMHNVIRTPEAQYTGNPFDRFELIDLNGGAKVVIEKRITRDIIQPGHMSRMNVRGIEYDKAVATLVLTSRRLGIPEYDRNSLQMSYPDFERIFLMQEGMGIEDLPTMQLMKEIIMNNVAPSAETAVGSLSLAGSPSHSMRITELIRSIAVQSAVLNLDVNTLEEADNFSALFRFGSSRGNTDLPDDVEILTQLGTSADNPTSLKYWSFSGAKVGHEITDKSKGLRYVLDGQDSMSTHLLSLVTNTAPADGDAVDTPDEDGDTVETPGEGGDAAPEVPAVDSKAELEKFLASAPDTVGVKDLAVLQGYAENQISIAQQILTLSEEMDPSQISSIIRDINQQNTSFAKEIPSIVIAQAALLKVEDEALAPILAQTVPRPRLNIEYGLILSNVELLNRLFYMVRPEYSN